MSARCEQLAGFLERGGMAGAPDAARWREHLASCAGCREQESVDRALRAALAPPPQLAPGFEGRLGARLASRRAAGGARRSGLSRRARWTLAGYALAATSVSLLIVLHLSWPSLTPLAAGITLGAAALIGPLVLLDRVGVILPPGPGAAG